ncbi:MAG: hypothetical protein K1000chlam4_00730 [Chlamydiae bacterium]|nr:hypothetical protein [Chlamydiota bacterium]
MKTNKQKTYHRLINGDARDLSFLSDESIHLVVTSPPYWNLKRLAKLYKRFRTFSNVR